MLQIIFVPIYSRIMCIYLHRKAIQLPLFVVRDQCALTPEPLTCTDNRVSWRCNHLPSMEEPFGCLNYRFVQQDTGSMFSMFSLFRIGRYINYSRHRIQSPVRVYLPTQIFIYKDSHVNTYLHRTMHSYTHSHIHIQLSEGCRCLCMAFKIINLISRT